MQKTPNIFLSEFNSKFAKDKWYYFWRKDEFIEETAPICDKFCRLIDLNDFILSINCISDVFFDEKFLDL